VRLLTFDRLYADCLLAAGEVYTELSEPVQYRLIRAIFDVGKFLEYVGVLRDSGTREGAAWATAEGVVQIMSVHAAKGLEFPIVIISGADSTGGGPRTTLIAPGLGVLQDIKDEDDTRSSVHRLATEGAAAKDGAESDRLLYVAATRAREKLVFGGCVMSARSRFA
jgi:ATP-dependent helicase/nuclease subunit A